MAHYEAFLLLLLVSLTFASILPTHKDISVATYNIHGFSASSNYVHDCISKHGGIWMLQEHWLSEHQLQQLDQLNVQYVARSGMEDAISAGIYRGRPFGGVAICWSPDLNHIVTPVSNFKHKRVVAVEMKRQNRDILLICAYMPFFNSSKRDQCIIETLDAISMIEVLIEDHQNHEIIIGGDLNTELRGNSPFDALWEELMSKNSFTHCDSLTTGPNYTYRHESLNQSKFNDHFIISQTLLQHTFNHKIVEDGDNNSDHLPLLMNLSVSISGNSCSTNPHAMTNKPQWNRMSASQLSDYADNLERLLLRRQRERAVFSCDKVCSCRDSNCYTHLQEEYDEIIQSMITASLSLPKGSVGNKEKNWWSPNLTALREQSIDIQSAWIAEGRPRQGPTYTERLRVRAAYKREIRNAKKAPKQAAWNRLHSDLINNNTNSFWKRWRGLYGKNKSQFAPVVDGHSSKDGIANAFKSTFMKNSRPNNSSKVAELDARFSSSYETFASSHLSNCDCNSYKFSLENTFEAICSLKDGKSADDDGLCAEHFKNGPLLLFIKLTSLFNCMLRHGFVPYQFRFGTITPIIKDKNGNASDVNNYRGITISPLSSKIFERVLKGLFSKFLTSSSYQFGFKGGSSTSHALFCLSKTVNYYIDHGSRVFCSFLDASKAFDRLIHSGLFIKLIERKTPKLFVDVLMNWYHDLQCRVKWDNFYGDWFPISAGVRQGGILSPDFYNIYVDDLICKLQKLKVGCYISKLFAAAIFYADDMCVLSPSLRGLQKLLDACSSYCTEWDICLNVKKTKNMYFGKNLTFDFHPTLNNIPIDWVKEWKYLGVTLKSGRRFNCSITERVKSFYRSLNSILRVEGRSDDMLMLQLVETHCIPVLTYAIEIVHVANQDERRSLRVAYNSVYRKLFGYRIFESVTELQHSLSRPTWEELVAERHSGFLKRARSCDPDTLVRAFC